MKTEAKITYELDAPELVDMGDGRFGWRHPETGRILPAFAGAADAPVSHPLGPPTVTDTSITIDLMLRQPTRITHFLMDITLQRFFADRLFSSPGGVTGGAVVYDEIAENELYLDRDIQRVAPGQEFPVVNSSRRAPKIAEVEKWGGKYFITYEARDRNDTVVFRNHNVKLGNTIVRKHNQRAVAAIEAAIAGTGGASTFVGNDWSAYLPVGMAPNTTAPAASPHADFAKAQLLADQRELGINFDTLAVNPVNATELRLGYEGRLSQVLADNGIEEMFVTNRITAGTAYIFAANQVGQMRNEQPLATQTWDEEKTQKLWTQASVRSVMFVDNPYAVMKITGI